MFWLAGLFIAVGATWLIDWKSIDSSLENNGRYQTIKLICGHLNVKIIREFALYKTRRFFIEYFQTGYLDSNKTHHVLHYHDGESQYIVMFPKKRGPKKFHEIRDTFGEIVTSDVVRYMGPSNNFHGIDTTPKMLGYKRLTFCNHDGTYKTFEEEDIVKL